MAKPKYKTCNSCGTPNKILFKGEITYQSATSEMTAKLFRLCAICLLKAARMSVPTDERFLKEAREAITPE